MTALVQAALRVRRTARSTWGLGAALLLAALPGRAAENDAWDAYGDMGRYVLPGGALLVSLARRDMEGATQLAEGVPADAVEAALAVGLNDVHDTVLRARALADWKGRDDAPVLQQGLKRVANILRNIDEATGKLVRFRIRYRTARHDDAGAVPGGSQGDRLAEKSSPTRHQGRRHEPTTAACPPRCCWRRWTRQASWCSSSSTTTAHRRFSRTRRFAPSISRSDFAGRPGAACFG